MAMGLGSEYTKTVVELSELVCGKVQHIIHYKGQVTEVVNATLGIYVLDKKFQLCFCIPNKFSEEFKCHDNLLLSNVHIVSVNNQKFLVCCALSTITKVLSCESMNTLVDEHIQPLKEHRSCFPDLFMKCYFINFNLYIVKQFLWNLFHYHYLKASINDSVHITSYQKHFRKWDQDFFKEPFTKAYPVPSISFLISEAKSRIIWSKQSLTWDHATVSNNELYGLVGFLFLKENGCFVLSDSRSVIPCIFVNDFTFSSAFNSDLICGISSGSEGYYVTINKYCFVFERYCDNAGNISSCSYICTSTSYMLPLEKVCRMNKISFSMCHNFSKADISNSQMEDERDIYTQQYYRSSTQILESEQTDVSVITSLLKEKLSLSIPAKTIQNQKVSYVKYLCQEFKMLAKAWSSEKDILVFRRAFVLLLDQKSVYVLNDEFTSPVELPNSTNIGKMETEGDEGLTKLMKNLQLEQKLKYTMLDFIGSSSKTCSNLRPGHKYWMFIPYRHNAFSSKRRKPLLYLHHNKEGEMHVPFIGIDKNIKILHSLECFLSNTSLEDFSNLHIEAQSVKGIILNRHVLQDNIVKGILVNKSFENDFNSQSNKILRLILKDLETTDSIPVYISCYPRALYGLLPGVELELIGCQCVSSQKGNLYLRSSDFFGLHVSNMHRSSANIIFCSNQLKSINEVAEIFILKNLNSSNCPMIFECFNGLVLKITYAQISFACMKCFQCIEKRCSCESEYMEMTEVSFDVDDGSNTVSMHGAGDVLRSLLKLTQNEWEALVMHVLETKQALKYNYLEKSKILRTFMLKLFLCLCCNNAIIRPVNLRCCLQNSSDGKSDLKYSCICLDLSDLCLQDAAAKLYIALTR